MTHAEQRTYEAILRDGAEIERKRILAIIDAWAYAHRDQHCGAATFAADVLDELRVEVEKPADPVDGGA